MDKQSEALVEELRTILQSLSGFRTTASEIDYATRAVLRILQAREAAAKEQAEMLAEAVRTIIKETTGVTPEVVNLAMCVDSVNSVASAALAAWEKHNG